MAYLKSPHCAYGLKGEDDLDSFIRNDLGVVDIPFLILVDVALPIISSPLKKEKVFLLLEWIHHLTVISIEKLQPRAEFQSK